MTKAVSLAAEKCHIAPEEALNTSDRKLISQLEPIVASELAHIHNERLVEKIRADEDLKQLNLVDTVLARFRYHQISSQIDSDKSVRFSFFPFFF